MAEEKKQVKQQKTESYVVVQNFTDLQDGKKKYKKGDKYDATGKTKTRIKELSTTKNKQNKVLIKKQG